MNAGFGQRMKAWPKLGNRKEFYRKASSLKRFRPFRESPDSESALILFPNVAPTVAAKPPTGPPLDAQIAKSQSALQNRSRNASKSVESVSVEIATEKSQRFQP